MKKRLYLRLILLFLAFGIIGFILISTVTSHLVLSLMTRRASETLYREANIISKNYAQEYYQNRESLEDLRAHLEILDSYMGCQIWIIGRDGSILVNSRSPVEDMSHPETLPEFDATDFGNRFYQVGSFYGYFPTDQLSVYAPITRNYGIVGYVVLHEPLTAINETGYGILNISYITWGILTGIAFLVLFIIALTIIHPIRRIAKVAGAYAGGDFSQKKVKVRQSNEIGYLSASLNYMADEMNTLEEDQRKFISNVSHDFRSPLTSIKGYIEAMLDGTIPPEMQEKYLRTILFETERLTKLTAGILELNKYGAHGRTILDISTFDIHAIIKHTLQTFEGACIEKRITFEVILTGAELMVSADMAKIQQVLYNLIDNAIKFSHHDSIITIETTLKNEKVFVSVKDRGVGIPKESLGKIWERFYKSDSSRGRDKKGTGLGLSIVKDIISAHNENINVISTEDVGTEFIFTLPLAKEDDGR